MTKISIKEKREVEFKFSRHIYSYSKYYDEKAVHKKESNWSGIILYLNPRIETELKICSLDGHFVSKESLLSNFKETLEIRNPVIKRDEMEKFEKRYSGRFFPLEIE